MFLFSVIVITLPRVKQRRIFSILLTFYIIIVVTFKKCGKLPSRKFGNHQTVHRPSQPQALQPKSNSRFYLERNRMAARTFRKKKQQQSRVFFNVIFYVYTHVDNREGARASD